MKKYIAAIVLSISALTLSGQDVIWKLTYDVGFPFAETEEFAGQVSWRGLSLYMDRFINDNLAVGTSFSWSVFLEKEEGAYYEDGNMLVHGTQMRYINNLPLLGRISYYLPVDPVEAFFSLGIGTAWQERVLNVGTWNINPSDDNGIGSHWHFALAPELGILIPTPGSSLTAKLRYVQGFKTANAPALSYLSVGLGIAW